MATFFISHSSEDRGAVERLRDRLRAWGYGSMFLDFDPQDGIAVGREWEQELYAQLHAADAVVFVASQASVTSQWCFLELGLARSARKPIFPVAIEAGVRMSLLEDRQWLELSDGEVADARLERALRERFDPRDALSWDVSRPPYPGLFAFEASDAGVFFGRDDKVAEVLAHLDATLGRGHCVAVIGASGSGKSSLVRAGVLPRLTRLSERWVVLGPLTPGERPVGALARALAAASPGLDREALQRRIERDPSSLAATLRDLAVGGNGGRRSVLVVVDQAEELVVQADMRERARFVELLQGALGCGVPVWVLATLRSEFLSASLRDEALVEFIQDTVLVGPLDRARLPQVILGPARKAGLEFSPGLVERMVADTRGGDALPLLAYTLRELYDRERPNLHVITDAGYDAIGGVEGALRRRAHLVLRELEDRGIAERVLPTLLRLVTVDAEGEPARRRLARSALTADEFEIVRAFVEARLVVVRRLGGEAAPDGAGAGGREDAVVEVAHEALLRAWEPLREAIQSSREVLQLKAELGRDGRQWDEQGRPDSYLLRGERLGRARRLLTPAAGGVQHLDRIEREFLAASEDLERRERAAVNRRRRRAIAGLSVTLVLISAAALISLWQYRDARDQAERAREQARVAQSQALSASARQTAGSDPLLSAQLAREAVDVAPTIEAEAVLRRTMSGLRHLVLLRGHSNTVWSAAFSPDGRHVVTASLDRTARIWDAASGEEVGLLRGHGGRVQSAVFSPDGERVLTASSDRTARIWDAASGEEISSLRGHVDRVDTAAFSPDGERVVTASSDRTARIWDAASGDEIKLLRGHRDWVVSADFSPDGERVVTASFDRTARIWDASSGREIRSLRGHDNRVESADFSPDGERVVTASSDRTARIWDAASGEEIRPPLLGHRDALVSAAFSPDGERVVTASFDATARIWDAASGEELRSLRGHGGGVVSAVFSPDGERVVTASSDRTARIWDAASREEIGILRGHKAAVVSAAFSPDGEGLVTASFDATARIWDAASGQEIRVLRGHGGRVVSAAFSPDGKRVVTANFDGSTARIWDAASGEEMKLLRGHEEGVVNAAFSPDGERVVTGSEDRTARIWDAASGEQIGLLRDHDRRVDTAAFSPDGERVVTASFDGTARIWDAASGEEIGSLRGHGGRVQSAAFSPDGERVVTASSDRTARIWDAASGDEIGSLRGHSDRIESAVFSPDGERVVTASLDRTARIWDAASGEEIKLLRGHGAGVVSAVFSPDGERVVTASGDRTARIWACGIACASRERLERAAELVGDLDPDQRAKYLSG